MTRFTVHTIVATLFASALLQASANRLPRDADSVGKVAFIPTRDGENQDFVAHLAPQGEGTRALTRATGKWVPLEGGIYHVWLQGEWLMSPYAIRFVTTGFDEPLQVHVPVGPAGRIEVRGASAGDSVRFIHLSHYKGAGTGRKREIEFDRSPSEASEGVLLPVGNSVIVAWDPAKRLVTRLSRPTVVRAGATTTEALLPSKAAQLLLEADLVGDAMSIVSAPDLYVEREGRKVHPDFVNLSADKLLAGWYELPAGPAILVSEGAEFAVPRTPLDFRSGQVEYVRTALERLPGIDVQLALPASLAEQRNDLAVVRVRDRATLARASTKLAEERYRFANLPRDIYDVVLTTPEFGSFFDRVDLSSGRDVLAILDPELIVLHGTVRSDRKGVKAVLEFSQADSTTRQALADENGLYEFVTLLPVHLVSVALVGDTRPPFSELLVPAASASRELDFLIPTGDFRVRVIDATTRSPIGGASVVARNRHAAEALREPEPGQRTAERVVAQQVTTDSEGEAQLGPLHKGTVEFRVKADGYRPQRSPASHPIDDADGTNVFEVALARADANTPVRVLLSSGMPAVGASVRLVLGEGQTALLYEAQADGSGRLNLPQEVATLLATHPNAGATVELWQPTSNTGEEITVHLAPLAASPLVVRAIDDRGNAIPWARAILWIRGVRVAGNNLGWLLRGSSATDANGMWSTTALPAEALSLLFVSPALRDTGFGSNIDSYRLSIPYPWPNTVEFRVIQ